MTARNPSIPEDQYQHLLDCRDSGQIPESAWQEHLKDKGFREWVEGRPEQSKEPELKPCPFCGDESISDYGSAGIGSIKRFWNCDNCGCQGPSTLMRPPETVEEANARAAEKWNERADSDTALIGELVEALEPFAALLKEHHIVLPDDRPIFGIAGSLILAGDLRCAYTALTRARKRTGGA